MSKWTQEEDEMLFVCCEQFGRHYVYWLPYLPGRTISAICARWNRIEKPKQKKMMKEEAFI
jgi:hypothetical protein